MEFQVILGLISSFLSNRWLQVVLDGNSSQEYPVNAGVPEGSILGLALFLLYINDLPDDVICNITICADECILYSMWLGNWFLATTRIGFLTGIWPMRRCGLGQEVACWFQCWKNSASFVWSIQKHWCYWCENVWVSSWRKNHLLRCWCWLSLLNCIGALPWFVLWSFFLLSLLCISINQTYSHVWKTVVMCGLVLLVIG